MDSLGNRFEKITQEAGTATALVIDDVPYTYATLHTDVNKARELLNQAGVQPEQCVAVMFSNGYDFIVFALATFSAGAVLLPLNNSYQPEEIQYYLDHADVKLVCGPRSLSNVSEYVFNHAIPWLDENALSHAQTVSTASPCDKGGMYLYSSGSTGKSKRVFRTQHALLDEYDDMSALLSASANDNVLCTLPLYHSHGFSNGLLMALLSGATCILLTNEFNGRKTLQALADHRITLYPAVPFMYQIMALANFRTPPDLSSLRHCFSAGAPLSPKIVNDFYQKTGKYIGQIYGSSETGVICCNTAPDVNNATTVGFPIPCVELEIRGEDGNLLADDQEGEIWVRSPAMTHQYDGMPEATKENFVGGWFCTGDLGVRNELGISVTGRKKLLINVAGNKVDPLEVESLLNSHALIEESVVVAKPHEVYGEQVVAYVVLLPDRQITTDDLYQFIKGKLVEYKVPKQIVFLQAIPKSPLGKVLRKYL